MKLLAKNIRIEDVGSGCAVAHFLDKRVSLDKNSEVEQEQYECVGFRFPPAEAYEELIRVMPNDAYRKRAFLVHHEYGEGGADIFYVGENKETGIKCTSAKQAAIALRKHFPFREHGEDEQPEQRKVVPFTGNSASDWRERMALSDTWRSPSSLF